MAGSLIRWWGYLHENGTYHVKRAFEHTIESDLEDAYESDSVLHVVEPFWARDRSYALRVVEDKAMQWCVTQK